MIIKIIISIIVVFFILHYLFPIVKVCGDSMFPTYHDGEVLITFRILRKNRVKNGDVVIYQMHENGKRNVIKRVADVKTVGNKLSFYCLGDNSDESYDSRYYGYIPSAWLVCKPFNQRLKEVSKK